MTVMLTTIDNPYNPFTEWDEWFAYDEQKGYNTCSYLDRIVKSSYDLTPTEQENSIELAIDEIIRVNGLGFYKKVTNDDEFYKNKIKRNEFSEGEGGL